MRLHPFGYGVIAAFTLACSSAGAGLDSTVSDDRDAGRLEEDGGLRSDSGVLERDGSIPVDVGSGEGGLLVDSGVTPELCTGGVDEDGDAQVDCADDACWTYDTCVLSDVRGVVPNVVACGAPITIDVAATRAACTALGTPRGSTYPTECAAGMLEVAARTFCDASGAVVALWIEERLATPSTRRMLGPRRFESTYYEHASVVDWEEQRSGASSHSGSSSPPIHDGWDYRGGFRVITIRPVMQGDTISRLLGMVFITSIIDLDAPMSMDTRRILHTGGLVFSVPGT